jgi:nucleoid DNA-binding protein
MAVQMTKSQLIEKISSETEVAKKDVKGVIETMASVATRSSRSPASSWFRDLPSSS